MFLLRMGYALESLWSSGGPKRWIDFHGFDTQYSKQAVTTSGFSSEKDRWIWKMEEAEEVPNYEMLLMQLHPLSRSCDEAPNEKLKRHSFPALQSSKRICQMYE